MISKWYEKLKKFRPSKTVKVVGVKLILAFAGLGMVSYGISLIYAPAGVIAGGISILLILLEMRGSDG